MIENNWIIPDSESYDYAIAACEKSWNFSLARAFRHRKNQLQFYSDLHEYGDFFGSIETNEDLDAEAIIAFLEQWRVKGRLPGKQIILGEDDPVKSEIEGYLMKNSVKYEARPDRLIIPRL